MATIIPKPDRPLESFVGKRSPACMWCADCRVKITEGGDRTGVCVSENNRQDSKGVIPEFIEDVLNEDGYCGSFRHSTTRMQKEVDVA